MEIKILAILTQFVSLVKYYNKILSIPESFTAHIVVPSNETLRENDIASLLSREGERFGGLEDPVEPNLLAFEQVLNPQHASTKEVTGHNMSTLTKMTSSQIPQRRVKEHSSEGID